MNLTNKYKLPEVLYKAISTGMHPPKRGHIPVTHLIAPPLVRYYLLKDYDNITLDASDFLWTILGSMVHKVLENAISDTDESLLSEQGLEYKVNDITIVGRYDLFEKREGNKGNLCDWKVTSVNSFLLGEKKEWEQQLNVYAYMMQKMGYEVENLYIYAILRDWAKSKIYQNKDYPEIPFIVKKIPIWGIDEQEKFIMKRIALFEDIEKKENPDLSRIARCTDEEKWSRGGNIALIQNGRKSAVKLFDSWDETSKIKLLPGQKFVERKVEFARCKDYCSVRNKCIENVYLKDKNKVVEPVKNIIEKYKAEMQSNSAFLLLENYYIQLDPVIKSIESVLNSDDFDKGDLFQVINKFSNQSYSKVLSATDKMIEEIKKAISDNNKINEMTL